MHDQHPGFWLPLFWEPGHQKYLERAIKSIINNWTRLSMKMKKIMQIEEGFTPPRTVEPIHTKSNPTIIFLSIQNIQSNLKHAFLVLCKAPSLRSKRLEVAGERGNGRARGRHARGEGASSPLACLLLARPFFLVPITCKRLLRRL